MLYCDRFISATGLPMDGDSVLSRHIHAISGDDCSSRICLCTVTLCHEGLHLWSTNKLFRSILDIWKYFLLGSAKICGEVAVLSLWMHFLVHRYKFAGVCYDLGSFWYLLQVLQKKAEV